MSRNLPPSLPDVIPILPRVTPSAPSAHLAAMADTAIAATRAGREGGVQVISSPVSGEVAAKRTEGVESSGAMPKTPDDGGGDGKSV